MSILETVNTFAEQEERGSRAVFEAAMTERIDKHGYRMSDLMFEVYTLQRAVSILNKRLDKLESKKK